MERKPHPAKYSDSLLPVLARYSYGVVLDIMGGVGKAGLLKGYNPEITKVIINELEPEWGMQSVDYGVDEILIGDARDLRLSVDCIVTSPPYGNRMADNFKAGSKGGKSPTSMRKMYAGDLGRTPSAGSVCCLHFDKGYQEEIMSIYDSIISNCSFKRFVINVSNFVRQFKIVKVVDFFENYFNLKGFRLMAKIPVKTKRQKGVGANTELRVSHEIIMVFEKVIAQ